MARYRSRPSEVEAVQWTGKNRQEIEEFAAVDKVDMDRTEYGQRVLMLLAGAEGAQGWVPVPVGHWLVHQPGDKSDIWPVEPDYFEAKYEPVEK